MADNTDFVTHISDTCHDGTFWVTVSLGHYRVESEHPRCYFRVEKRGSPGGPKTTQEVLCPKAIAEILLLGLPEGHNEDVAGLILKLTSLARSAYALLEADCALLGESYDQERAAWVAAYRTLFPSGVKP